MGKAGLRRSPDERIGLLEARTGVFFRDRTLALSALTHKTYLNEHRGEAATDNERLEFLGDSVVNLAVSHRLMERFASAAEGDLSRMRASLVNEESLAQAAKEIGLGELLLLGRGEENTGGRSKSSLLADALEAVVGAVYLDGGLAPALGLVDRLFAGNLQQVLAGMGQFDYKTRLQEAVQGRLGLTPRYRVLGEVGPEHRKVFEVEVTVSEAWSAKGKGRSKKEAEQAAAREALEKISTLDNKP